MTAEVRAIREDELGECLRLWYTVFENDPPGYFERYFAGDPDFEKDYTRVCVVDGRIVSAVHVVKRVVACGEFTLTMGGIANVATDPAVRGRGYASECLRQAVAVMQGDAMDFSTLGTGVPAFYARLGWECTPRRHLAGAIQSDPPDSSRKAGSAGVAVRPYAASDERAIQRVYSEFNAERPITVRRTPHYWRHWIGLDGDRIPGHILVAESAGEPVGYCMYWKSDLAMSIEEIGWSAANAGAADALVGACAREAARSGAVRMELRIPPTLEIRRAAANHLCGLEECERSGSMVRFVDIEKLLRGILPVLWQRWSRAGKPRGELTFAGSGGPVGLRSDERQLSVAPTHGAGLSQAELFRLLCGHGLAVRRLADANMALAAALFPPCDGWYWGLDGF